MTRLTIAMLSTCATLALAAPSLAATGEEVLDNVCAACHVKDAAGGYSRIDDSRRTPEGWDMNVVRMIRNYGLSLSDEDRSAVVRHLADTRGLSIEETEGYRYILEKELRADDAGPNQLMTETCARCHSYARVALQRRTAEDWEKLIHFHVGQFPTLEYQALARDRDLWAIANNEVLDVLTERYVGGEAPAKATADLTGEWRVAGHQPGRGDYTGVMTVTADGEDYDVQANLSFADGSETQTGRAILYGAGEWRGSLMSGETELRQVFALRADGTMDGRWFHIDQDSIGGRIKAAKADAAPQILSVSPGHLKAGESAEITVTGIGLAGAPVLPAGVNAEVVSQDANTVVLKATAAADAVPGAGEVRLGEVTMPEGLTVYPALDRISVEPPRTFSRIGGNDGPIPKQPAQFEAIGWMNGPDGTPETEDDIRVGVMEAEWRTENFDEEAERMQDTEYAGVIQANGLFEPGGAGPNLERPMMANNVGNLNVIATVTDGDQTHEAKAHLYATVQRFIDMPIN
ncbi:quinohemoprotein amine dehydrogenase subunit alpha [Paracoccus sp. Z118]|uniref:quinohemoprotein amine dehydrogenase subunit alpha n=1 Tax=Paracoccus sp. Z118 TaxID=2851017 RepID=UPI001C2CA9F6|nr:quinohemoprotein amine dehydrogenase subunit alpha [Paracoccus sp. Z118]MBV0892795.1 quinohemoprotein amine dehydrogenase subunit alpha [Paracoccus sp. Z118]